MTSANIDLSGLHRSLQKKGGEEESVRPALMLSLFSEVSLHELGPRAAAALRLFIDWIPKDSLCSALIRDYAGKLTARRISSDLKRLGQPAQNDEFILLRYSSSPQGQPGDYGITFVIADLTVPVQAEDVNLLRFEFPWDSAEGTRADEFADFMARLADEIPFSAGTCSFGFSHWADDSFAKDQIYQMAPRYVGFDHCDDHYVREAMRGRTPPPGWLTFLCPSLMDALGGVSGLQQVAPEAKVRELAHGYMIRAARHPPVGDVNHGAPDLGSLPSVARFLAPKRLRLRFLRGSGVQLDVDAWLARFEPFPAGPWENR